MEVTSVAPLHIVHMTVFYTVVYIFVGFSSNGPEKDSLEPGGTYRIGKGRKWHAPRLSERSTKKIFFQKISFWMSQHIWDEFSIWLASFGPTFGICFSVFDLINIHLFHDASNITAMEAVSIWHLMIIVCGQKRKGKVLRCQSTFSQLSAQQACYSYTHADSTLCGTVFAWTP